MVDSPVSPIQFILQIDSPGIQEFKNIRYDLARYQLFRCQLARFTELLYFQFAS